MKIVENAVWVLVEGHDKKDNEITGWVKSSNLTQGVVTKPVENTNTGNGGNTNTGNGKYCISYDR